MEPGDNEQEREPAEDEESGTTVDLEDEGGDDDGEEPAAEAGGQQQRPKTRADKKRERGQLRADHERTTRENQELKDRIARLEGAVGRSVETTRRETQTARDQDDPTETALNDVYEQQQTLQMQIDALGNKITKEQLDRFQRQARQLETRKSELIAERVGRRNAPQPGQVEHQADLRAMQMQYPDVYRNAAALRWSQGRYHQIVARDATKEGLEGIRMALDDSRKEFGLRRDPPTETERSKFSGVHRGGGGTTAAAPTSIKLTKGQMKMADTAYSHIKDKAKRYKLWASKAGKRMAEQQRSK